MKLMAGLGDLRDLLPKWFCDFTRSLVFCLPTVATSSEEVRVGWAYVTSPRILKPFSSGKSLARLVTFMRDLLLPLGWKAHPSPAMLYTHSFYRPLTKLLISFIVCFCCCFILREDTSVTHSFQHVGKSWIFSHFSVNPHSWFSTEHWGDVSVDLTIITPGCHSWAYWSD